MISPADLAKLLEAASSVFLLDVRVQQQYARSRISGALNLCIPTTLLKRPSYDVQKLADTFTDRGKRAQFERWQASRYIVVYDEKSSSEKEAATCVSTIKKFTGETWHGQAHILRGEYTGQPCTALPIVVARDECFFGHV
jgi:protein-tyrosine phosphatase